MSSLEGFSDGSELQRRDTTSSDIRRESEKAFKILTARRRESFRLSCLKIRKLRNFSGFSSNINIARAERATSTAAFREELSAISVHLFFRGASRLSHGLERRCIVTELARRPQRRPSRVLINRQIRSA